MKNTWYWVLIVALLFGGYIALDITYLRTGLMIFKYVSWGSLALGWIAVLAVNHAAAKKRKQNMGEENEDN